MQLGIGVRGKVGEGEEKEDGWKQADDGLNAAGLVSLEASAVLKHKNSIGPHG